MTAAAALLPRLGAIYPQDRILVERAQLAAGVHATRPRVVHTMEVLSLAYARRLSG